MKGRLMGGARQFILTTIVLLVCHSSVRAQGGHIEWVGNWGEAQALAARHQRLILMHFWGADCPRCVKLERAVYNQPEFIRALGTNYVALKVNAAEDPALVRHYRVEKLPTDVILAANGQELYRSLSPAETNQYIAMLDQVAAHARVGMPSGVGPSMDASLARNMSNNERTSAFPIGPSDGSAYRPSTGYQLPASNAPPASYRPTNGDLPAGSYNRPDSQAYTSAYNPTTPFMPSGPPSDSSGPQGVSASFPANPATMVYNPNVAYGTADAPTLQGAAETTAAPRYVVNQWAGPGTQTAQPPVAEQRASYTTPTGGALQLPAVSPVSATSSQFPVPNASSSTLGPPSTSAAILGPPSFDVSAGTPAMTGPGVNPPSMGPPSMGPPSMGPPSMGPPSMGPPSMGPPSIAAQPPLGPAAEKERPPLGLDGYCPVTLVEREKWVKGDPKYGALHRGRTYLFAGPEEQARFLDREGYEKYAPALSGYDPVKYAEQGTLVDGKRVHGVFYRGQVFLFADEVALQQFWTAPERFATAVRVEQQRSAMRSGMQR
ncbi:MAG: hypothetical protein ACYC3X_03950 [Pirellulaceae bacterium]